MTILRNHALILPLLFFCPWSFAELSFTDDSSLFNLSLEQLRDIPISVANKAETHSDEVASSVTVYSREEIQNMGLSSLDELLNYIPGYKTAREDSARLNAITVRGRSVNANTPDVLVLVNGIRVNDPVTGGALYNLSTFSLDNIKQVEVLRGPSSVLYGSNAFSGVINVVTENTKALKAQVGEFNHRKASVQFNQQFGQFTVDGFIGTLDDDGEDYAPFVEFFSTFEATSDPQSGSDAQINMRYDNWHYRFLWTERDYTDFVVGGTLGNSVNSFDRSLALSALSYDIDSSFFGQISLFGHYLKATQNAQILFYPGELAASLPLGWTNGSDQDLMGGNRRSAKEYRLGFDAKLSLNPQHQLSYGINFRQEKTGLNAFQSNINTKLMESSLGEIRVPSDSGIELGYWLPGGARLDLIKPYHRDTFGAYLQDQWQAAEHFSVTWGIRYDDYQAVGSNTSIRAAALYTLNSQQQLKLLYGQAFRAPSLIETRAEFSSVEVGNPDLKPELIETLDIIWTQQWANTTLTANVFFSEIDQEIVVETREIFSGFNSLQPVNKQQRKLSGIELELQSNLSDDVYLHAGYSFFDRYQHLGASRSLGFIALNYHADNWNVNVNSYYHDKVLARAANGDGESSYIDSYWLVNAAAKYQINNQWVIGISGKNILDEQYTTYTTSQNLGDGLPARGRQWIVDFTWYF